MKKQTKCDNCETKIGDIIFTDDFIHCIKCKRKLKSISSKVEGWQERFDKIFSYGSAVTPDMIKTFIKEELEKALDTQRIQHSRTMAILIKDHEKKLEKAKEIGFDRGYRTRKLIKKLKK